MWRTTTVTPFDENLFTEVQLYSIESLTRIHTHLFEHKNNQAYAAICSPTDAVVYRTYELACAIQSSDLERFLLIINWMRQAINEAEMEYENFQGPAAYHKMLEEAIQYCLKCFETSVNETGNLEKIKTWQQEDLCKKILRNESIRGFGQ